MWLCVHMRLYTHNACVRAFCVAFVCCVNVQSTNVCCRFCSVIMRALCVWRYATSQHNEHNTHNTPTHNTHNTHTHTHTHTTQHTHTYTHIHTQHTTHTPPHAQNGRGSQVTHGQTAHTSNNEPPHTHNRHTTTKKNKEQQCTFASLTPVRSFSGFSTVLLLLF